jgi:hypothetical protein
MISTIRIPLYCGPRMYSKTVGGNMPLFLIYCFLVHDTDMREGNILHYGCMEHVEVGLKQVVCRELTCVFQVKVSREITQHSPSILELMLYSRAGSNTIMISTSRTLLDCRQRIL